MWKGEANSLTCLAHPRLFHNLLNTFAHSKGGLCRRIHVSPACSQVFKRKKPDLEFKKNKNKNSWEKSRLTYLCRKNQSYFNFTAKPVVFISDKLPESILHITPKPIRTHPPPILPHLNLEIKCQIELSINVIGDSFSPQTHNPKWDKSE